ncbi:aldo/keto reductase [Synechococcus elongatus IITB4]|uniref:aldo/keto reductase n=1 Tax=Synechococcus elongatus TaxID=32046 RepID=UPI0030CBB930
MTIATTCQLGPDGPTVSALGIGTWAWGDSLYWTYGKDYDETQLQETFAAAIVAGVSFFDTAEVYGLGESERILGRCLQQTAQPAQIATKYFPIPWRFGSRSVQKALDQSLERLQRQNVELYQVHWPPAFLLGQTTILKTLAAAVKRGQIQAIGVSNYNAQQLHQAHALLAEQGVPLAVNQVQYSLLERRIETNGSLAAARELGVTILAYCPLAQGLLTGKYRSEADLRPTGARKINPQFRSQSLEKLQPLLDQLAALADRYDRTIPQVALNWLIAQGNVIPIPGAKSPAQAQDNAGALGWQLSPEDVTSLSQLSSAARSPLAVAAR